MEKRFTHIILIIVLVGNIVMGCKSEETLLPEIPVELLLEGDIVFRRGQGIASDIVAYNDVQGKYSHVGIVVKSDSGMMIVHSVPGGNEYQDDHDIIRIESVERFFAKGVANRGEVMRMNLDEARRNLLNVMALKKVKQVVPFDHNYDLEDTTSLYCTELLQLLYRNIGIDLAQGRITEINVPGMSNSYIMPSDIYSNSDLKTILSF